MASGPLAVDAKGADDDAHADELQRDVGHQCEDAGEGDGYGEPAVAVAAADEVGEGDVAVAVADCPEPRQHEHHVGIGDDGVRDGEEAYGSGTVEGAGTAMTV